MSNGLHSALYRVHVYINIYVCIELYMFIDICYIDGAHVWVVPTYDCESLVNIIQCLTCLRIQLSKGKECTQGSKGERKGWEREGEWELDRHM